MIDYRRKDDLLDLDDKDKLKIVEIEIEKIININSLLFNALEYNKLEEHAESYIFVTKLIEEASWNIRKMFPY